MNELLFFIQTKNRINGGTSKSGSSKKQASMVLAAQQVKDGEADACISAGSTGALMALDYLLSVVWKELSDQLYRLQCRL